MTRQSLLMISYYSQKERKGGAENNYRKTFQYLGLNYPYSDPMVLPSEVAQDTYIWATELSFQ